jgi:hypothetical protein
MDRAGLVIAYGQAHEFVRIEGPSAQDRRPKPNRWISPECVRVRQREATELPQPVDCSMLGDPTGSVRMAIVLLYLLKTHNVRVQLVQPGHDLMATLRPPRSDRRVDVELHNPQHALGHAHRLPVLERTRLAHCGVWKCS